MKLQDQCSEDGCDKPVKARGLCQTHYHALWYAENSERQRARGRLYAEKNAEKLREYQRQRYLQNREQILKRERERAAMPEHRQRKRAAVARWREANPDREREKNRRWRAGKQYGLTLAEYEAILARGCAICGAHEGRLCLDHCHTTGKIRDALCHSCNAALGSFGDDPARLRAAADYLDSHGS